ncbi:Tex family protein [Oceanicoccus sagamiensis]|uniref:RNA-binding transcriptional accessory protein n=1 Tax=Oceanicoccus sagamiensis TaxID=716816 RepID=A0A1X9NDK5_9GAMM|nr:Tex family protein [Oceanicoccus sagamiensis]ARN73629.1 RNA-binding transcriptional accessory protein [Oceanicoccus sagamiensis]
MSSTTQQTSPSTLVKITRLIADELKVQPKQVDAAVALLDEGATVPFISRYRKEVTGGLDDAEMRQLENRLHYLRELEDRRVAILKSITEQDKLTPELEQDILAADTKNRLEDLYLPYKQKRRTKGQIAIEAGLEPLADALYQDPNLEPEQQAAHYIDADKGIADNKAALDGAKYILMERFSENADLLAKLRNFLWQEGQLSSRMVEGKEQEGAKFSDYFEHDEAINKTPSHRALAMFRGRNESILNLSIVVGDPDDKTATHPGEIMIAEHWDIKDQQRAADRWLKEVVRWTWRIKLYTHLETDLMGQLREAAEQEAISVFAGNLKDLLLAAPAGPKATIGLDPGLRTGCKVAVVDGNGKVLDHCAIYPTPPQNKIAEAAATLIRLAKEHQVELIAIGNGTASRETDRFVGDIISAHPELKLKKVMVNEAGASIYSASEYASKEYPDLDVTIRGAISIAHRLQDPLAELVKIEPKSIGVGQYQHDVSQTQLARSLDAVVEDCVNSVGVDVNTASSALLSRVSGLNQTIAHNIVELRDQQGSFKNREALKSVKRFGDKTFEQAAGFLRVMDGDNPLDASAVHPESYSVVEKVVSLNDRSIASTIGDSRFLKALNPADFTDEQFGLPTVTDILGELDKPGRDPRPEFKTAEFKDGVEKLSDLIPDMILEGTVTNVTNFGAFVDIGVHQDGLVHISALSDTFVKDPRTVVKAGDIVKVKVLEVDIPRKRIALTRRLTDKAEPQQKADRDNRSRGKANKAQHNNQHNTQRKDKSGSGKQQGTFAQLFADAGKIKTKS